MLLAAITRGVFYYDRPRMRYDRYQYESPIPDVRLCSSAAILNHLLCSTVSGDQDRWTRCLGVLCDFARLNNSFDFFDYNRADTHLKMSERLPAHVSCMFLTLFSDQAIVSVIGVVGISCYRAATVADDSKIELCTSLR
jgi:hypothetical protein